MVHPLGTFLLSLALGQYIPDNQCGYRLITRRALECMELGSSGFEMEVEMIAEALRRGLTIGWVPIRTHLRDRQAQLFPSDQGHPAVPGDGLAHLAKAANPSPVLTVSFFSPIIPAVLQESRRMDLRRLRSRRRLS